MAGVAALLLLVGGALAVYLYVNQISHILVDLTGETDLKQQAVDVISAVQERKLQTDDLAAMPYLDKNPYGVNTFLEQEVEPWKVQKSLDMLRDAGVHWIRQQFPWWDIETLGKGNYVNQFGQDTWVKYDRIVNDAQRDGIQVLATLDDPPNWSRAKNSADSNGPPDNYQDFGDYVYAVVSHFKGRIKYYQIWNEPNIYPEWGSPISARKFVQLLKIGYTRAKQADPSAVIVAPSLAATVGMPDGTAENDLTYLQQMYDDGARNYFDIMAVNGYGLWSGPYDRRLDRINFSHARLVRQIMVQNGDAAKPVWMSELGWNALPSNWKGPMPWGRVTRQQQAQYTQQAYQRAQQEWPWMGVMFYWNFRIAQGDNPDKYMFYWTMLNTDFTPHPVYGVYKQMATAPPVLRYGQHQETDWILRYSGAWTHMKDAAAAVGAYMTSSVAGATLSFTFHGTDLELVTLRAPGAGRLSVTIDGHSDGANKLTQQGGKAFVNLAARKKDYQVHIPIASGLSSGDHKVTMQVADPGAPVFVDALIVRDAGPNYLQWGIEIALALGAALVAGLGVWIARRRSRGAA